MDHPNTPAPPMLPGHVPPAQPPRPPQADNRTGRTMAAVVAGALGLGVVGLVVARRHSDRPTGAPPAAQVLPRIAGVVAIDAHSVLITRATPSTDDDDAGKPSTWTIARFDADASASTWEREVPLPLAHDAFPAIGTTSLAMGARGAGVETVHVYDLQTGAERWQASLPLQHETRSANLVGTPTRLLVLQPGVVTLFDWDRAEPMYRGAYPSAGANLILSSDQRWLAVGEAEHDVLELETGKVTQLPANADGTGCIVGDAWYGADEEYNLLRVELQGGAAQRFDAEPVVAALEELGAPISCGWMQSPGKPLRLVLGRLRRAIAIDVNPNGLTPSAAVGWRFDFGTATAGFDRGIVGSTDDENSLPWFGPMTRFVPILLHYDPAHQPQRDPTLLKYALGMFDVETGTLTQGRRIEPLHFYRAFRRGSSVFAVVQLDVSVHRHLISIDGQTGRVRNVLAADHLSASAHATAPGILWAWPHFGDAVDGGLPLVRLDDALNVQGTGAASTFAPDVVPQFVDGLFAPSP